MTQLVMHNKNKCDVENIQQLSWKALIDTISALVDISETILKLSLSRPSLKCDHLQLIKTKAGKQHCKSSQSHKQDSDNLIQTYTLWSS